MLILLDLVSGQEHGDPLGIKVYKTDTNLAFKLIPVYYLQSWSGGFLVILTDHLPIIKLLLNKFNLI